MSDRLTVILPPVLTAEGRIAEALDYSLLKYGDGWGAGAGLLDGDGWGDGWGDGVSSTDV